MDSSLSVLKMNIYYMNKRINQLPTNEYNPLDYLITDSSTAGGITGKIAVQTIVDNLSNNSIIKVGDGICSTMRCGNNNNASGDNSTVSGGYFNLGYGHYSTISGGSQNTASCDNSTVSGGSQNTASGYNSTVSGGRGNLSSCNNSTVSGGFSNTASGSYSTVSGGQCNNASGNSSFIGGGYINEASGYASTVSGGYSNNASGDRSTVGGGRSNIASGYASTVSGGFDNTASGYYSSILGGEFNSVSHYKSFIVGSNITSNRACTTFVNDLNIKSGMSGNIFYKSSDVGHLVPLNNGTAGQVLTFDGTNPSWSSLSGSGGGTWGSITGTLSDQTDLQSVLSGKQDIPVVVSGNTTAANDTNYTNVANATYTDPTPSEGKGFTVVVRNGSATVGGVVYSWQDR